MPQRQNTRSPRCGPGGVGARQGSFGHGRGFLLGSAGLALTAGTTGWKHLSTGGHGGCGPAGRGLRPPLSALRQACARCVCSRLGALLAQLSLPLPVPAPGLALPQPQQLPVSSFLGLRSPEGGSWPSSALLAQPTSEPASSCGLARGRGAARTALRAGLWMEQFRFRGQAARWKTHAQPVSGLKKKRRHISADVKSRLGHATVGTPGSGLPGGCRRGDQQGLLGANGRRQRCLPLPGLCPVSRAARRWLTPLTFSGQGLARSERSALRRSVI